MQALRFFSEWQTLTGDLTVKRRAKAGQGWGSDFSAIAGWARRQKRLNHVANFAS